ncbi:hypothetical protein K2173_003763 [Erythroxylum novogranatense]|uniref:Uncharacterized protein n=1 Tax=Erythroxylum novogranatense TaxID=1862640 RepID=A0AAV8SIW0_9ROSI|nr:hypothetical protein K2173_003763 [Erythroxylum novogranatense]
MFVRLGMKNLGAMNVAFHMKLGLSILTEPRKLCNQVICAKYNLDWNLHHWMTVKPDASPLWCNICVAFPMVMAGATWSVGNDQRVRFWFDSGMSGVTGHLFSHDIHFVPEEHLARHVCDYVDSWGDWDWEEFRGFLPQMLILKIVAIFPPLLLQEVDHLYWAPASNGNVGERKWFGINLLRVGVVMTSTVMILWPG